MASDGNGTKNRVKKCPICGDNIYLPDTKPVKWHITSGALDEELEPKEGGDVLLRLLVRRQGSLCALPRDGAHLPKDIGELPIHYAAEVFDYAHIMKGTEEYRLLEAEREIEELQSMAKEDDLLYGESDSHLWADKAIERIQTLVAQPHQSPPSTPVVVPTTTGDDQESLSPSTPQFLYFYQVRNAWHFYLSPLDIKILKAEYGEYSAFPSTLLARVEHISLGNVIDLDMRKKHRYLAHLPTGCDVAFLECDWSEIVKPSVLTTFLVEIQRRRQKNHEREAREERERMRAVRETEAAEYSRAQIESRENSPRPVEMFNETDFVALSSPPLSSPPPASHSFTPPKGRTIWGTPAVASLVHTSDILTSQDETEPLQNEDDGWLQGWEKDLLDGQEDDEATDPFLLGTSTPKRKGKKKKVLLMIMHSTWRLRESFFL
jgi:hypothetical protein